MRFYGIHVISLPLIVCVLSSCTGVSSSSSSSSSAGRDVYFSDDSDAVPVVPTLQTKEESEHAFARMHKFVDLAQRYAEQGDVKEAVRQMHKALEIRPEDPGLQLILAQALVLDKDYEAAASLMSYILKHLKDDADVHLLQGTIFEARGQLLEAVQSYDIAMGLEPQSTRPIISSAVILGKLGMVTEALGLLKHALTLEPMNAHARLYQSKLREEAAQDHLVATDEEQLKSQYEALELQPIPTSPSFVSPSCASAECEPVTHDRYTAQGYRLHSLPAAEIAEGTPLSYKAFREEFLEPRKPVVLRGAASQDTMQRFSRDSLLEACADANVSPRSVGQAGSWAGLGQPLPTTTLASFVSALTLGAHEASGYIFDAPLPKLCPEALRGWRVPKFFAQDLLQRLPASPTFDSLRDHWPSLFLGDVGTRADMHIDAWCSHFYMIMLEGRKRWTFFPRDQLHYLEKVHLAGTFRVNYTAFHQAENALFLNAAAGNEFPLARLLRSTQVLLEPGDILFVPAGTPHYVENIGDVPALAISGNFLDSSNLACATSVFEQQGSVDEKDAKIAHALASASFDSSHNVSADEDVLWEDFKQAR